MFIAVVTGATAYLLAVSLLLAVFGLCESDE